MWHWAKPYPYSILFKKKKIYIYIYIEHTRRSIMTPLHTQSHQLYWMYLLNILLGMLLLHEESCATKWPIILVMENARKIKSPTTFVTHFVAREFLCKYVTICEKSCRTYYVLSVALSLLVIHKQLYNWLCNTITRTHAIMTKFAYLFVVPASHLPRNTHTHTQFSTQTELHWLAWIALAVSKRDLLIITCKGMPVFNLYMRVSF